MALKTKVKVSNITNLSDARYCSGMGVDLLGFPVSSGTLDDDLKLLKDISSWVSGPLLVMDLTPDPSPEGEGNLFSGELVSIISDYNVSFIEVHVSILESLYLKESPLIVRMEFEEWPQWKNKLHNSAHSIEYILLTSSANAIPSRKLLEEISEEFDVLLGSGIDEDTIGEILKLPIKGIALTGGHEEKPGMKEYSSLADVLEKLEID
jgi:phosphoribosylanthranilate isomerase